MVYNSLAEIFESMDETRSRLRARLDSIESTDESARPKPDAWSVAEITEHLAIIEERLSKLFPMLLTKAEAGGLQRRPDQEFRTVSVENMVERSRREKYTAPETVRPTGNAPLSDSIARLERSREAIRELRPRLEALDLTSVTYPHPAFGPLDAYQWLVFLGVHEDRHLRQIESLMASTEAEARGE